MGLDVHFYETAKPVDHPEGHEPDDDCWDDHTVVYTEDFPEQADGIENKSCWTADGNNAHVHHSYGGYNQYRAWLCMAALGVTPETVWENPDDYRDRPFYFQINFADNEGIIGPKTAARLAKDYEQQRDYVTERIKGMPQPFDANREDYQGVIERMLRSYEEWANGFALAADTGMVVFG